jgi:hypothetical protein
MREAYIESKRIVLSIWWLVFATLGIAFLSDKSNVQLDRELPLVKAEVAREQAISRTPRVHTDQGIASDLGTPPTPCGNGARP